MKLSQVNVAAAAVVSLLTAFALASDCTQTSTGKVPISDLGSGLYLGLYEGGLYPGGVNVPPPAHHAAARAQAISIVPRLPNGTPSPDGKVVLVSIGMSNTTQEFCGAGRSGGCTPNAFMSQAAADPAIDHDHLMIIDGALGGQTAVTWDDATDANYDRVRDQELAPLGLTEAQVSAVWIKVADAGPTTSLPAANSDANALSLNIASIARAVHERYPNCRLAFLSSRIYAGYASTPLNPEPYAYESGFAVKWAIAEQIAQQAGAAPSVGYGPLLIGSNAPALVWGAYLWADGMIPRSDGLIWKCNDLNNDGTHPSPLGVEKVATLLMNNFLSSPYAQPWFRAPKSADLDGDGMVDGADLAILLAAWGPRPGGCLADLDWDNAVNAADLAIILANWSG